MISTRLIFGYILFFLLSGIIIYFLGTQTLGGFLILLMIYIFFGFVIHRAIATLRNKHKKTFVEFFVIFLYRSTLLISTFLVILLFFVYYQNAFNPATATQYTLSNGEKTVIFQGMSHVASEKFYKSVQDSIYKAKKSEYTLYYEGVKGGSEENKALFDRALGVKLDKNSYELLAKLYNFTHQNQEDFLGIVNNKDINVDISIDEIVAKYQNLTQDSAQNSNDGMIYDIEKDVLSRLENLNDKQLLLLRHFNTALMNFIVKHEGLQNSLLSFMDKEDIFSVILDERNSVVVEKITSSSEQKIFVMYGLKHFSGIFAGLQENNSDWEIISSEQDQIFSPPELETKISL